MSDVDLEEEFSEEQVAQYFNSWGSYMANIPRTLQRTVMRLGRPKTFVMHEQVLKLQQSEANMYLIVRGSAVLFQSNFWLEKFLEEKRVMEMQL